MIMTGERLGQERGTKLEVVLEMRYSSFHNTCIYGCDLVTIFAQLSQKFIMWLWHAIEPVL